MESPFYVYVIFRPCGTPCYVGKGKGRRSRAHENGSHNRHLDNIVKKHGVLPTVRVRTGLSEAEAFGVECALIAAIGKGLDGPLVNITNGGEGVSGTKLSTEQRASKAATLRSPEVRAQVVASNKSPEKRSRMREAGLGRTASAETRAKMSTSLLGRPKSPEHRAKMIGRMCSDETRQRMRDAAVNRPFRPRGPTSEETRSKIGAAHRGRRFSDEHRARLSSAKLGKKRQPHSSETKAKMAASAKIRYANNK